MLVRDPPKPSPEWTFQPFGQKVIAKYRGSYIHLPIALATDHWAPVLCALESAWSQGHHSGEQCKQSELRRVLGLPMYDSHPGSPLR